MRIYLYILLLIPSLLGAALVWDAVAADRLYRCTDSLGPFDFVPPFVHAVGGDHYIAPAWLVWLIWAALLGAALGLPAAAMRLGFWFYCHAKDKEVQS